MWHHGFRDSMWTRSAPATRWSYPAHLPIGQMSMTSAQRTMKYIRTLWRRWIWLCMYYMYIVSSHVDAWILFLLHNLAYFYHFTSFAIRIRRSTRRMVSCICLREIDESKKCHNGCRRLPKGKFIIVHATSNKSDFDIALLQFTIAFTDTTWYWRQRSASTTRPSNGSTQTATSTASRPTWLTWTSREGSES